jgi:hypothetical protein
VSLTKMEKTGIWVSVGATGMKPDWMPVTLDMTLWMGTQGLLNVDWVTVWFCTNRTSAANKRDSP